MRLRTEVAAGAVRTVHGGEIVLTPAQWALRAEAKAVRPGDPVSRLRPVLRHVESLEGGDVLAEVLHPVEFKVGEVLRFPA